MLLLGGLLIAASGAKAQLQPRIIGGEPAAGGEIPWQVAVIWNHTSLCGGALIHPQWVLTAAHCVYDGSDPEAPWAEPATVIVIAGTDDWASHYYHAPEKRNTASRVIGHPDYDPGTADNDIALLGFDAPIDCSGCVIDLVTRANEAELVVAGSTVGIASGWGNTSTEGEDFPDLLHKVALPVIGHHQCRHELVYEPEYITANMLCAGYPDGVKDTCQGDSGGPFAVPVSDGTGYALAGVVSWGYDCAAAGAPGVYARVACYDRWIADATDGDSGVASGDAGGHSCGPDDGLIGGDTVTDYIEPEQEPLPEPLPEPEPDSGGSSGGGRSGFGGIGAGLPLLLFGLLGWRRLRG